MVARVVLVVAITIVMISGSYSTSVYAESGDLLFTIANPGLKKDLFSSSLGTLNDLIIVGASGKDVDGIVGAGSLYVFDAITGDLKFTINNPDPKRGDGFGRHMITTDNYIVVGLDVEHKSEIDHKGKIFVFDDAGSLLHVIDNPNKPVFDEWFGDQIGSHGDKVVSGSIFPSASGDPVSMVHIFDESGDLRHSLKNSESKINSLEAQGNLVVGTPTRMYEEVSGTIHVFDDTGKLISSIEYPEYDLTNAEFGGYLSHTGDSYIALRSISDQTDHDHFLPLYDLIYIFDISTGDIVMTIEEPSLKDENRRSFITYVESTGSIVVSGLNWNENNPLSRTVHVFEGPSKPEVNYVNLPDSSGQIIEKSKSFTVITLVAVLAAAAVTAGVIVFWKKRK